jgi:formiminotetrahydrofolate cyclodeaminase
MSDKWLSSLASDAPTPSAGSAAATVVAAAAALVEKSARASIDEWSGAGRAAFQAHALGDRLRALAAANDDAYRRVWARLQVVGDDASAARDAALGTALAESAAVPLWTAVAAAEVAELAVAVAEQGAGGARGDAIAAAHLAAGGAAAAAALVGINLAIADDDQRAERAREEVARARRAALRAEG